ncbi:type II secretion system protein GspG [PVC group bacterium (ex Bugula neritina AB1)]|nr:type II secretion system protein GspG [PVC group bacterium (ex Bugula neritina AB1)]
MKKISKTPKGFTLIELLVVIVIISIVGAIAYPQTMKHISKAKQTSCQTQIEIFSATLDNYYLDNSHYPSTEQGLEALRTKPETEPLTPDWNGPYIKKNIPLDPWGKPYIYNSPGLQNPTSFDIISYGADGAEGGEGIDKDIVNWKSLKDA